MPRVSMTDRFLATVKPTPGARTDYFDSVTTGMALRVGERGHKGWSFHFTSPRDGRRARVALGTYPALSLAMARGRALEARGYVDEGKDPRDVFAAETSGAMTVADLIESYLEKHVRPNLRSAPAIERRIEKNVIPLIGAVRVADIHKRDINRVLDPILARGSRIMAARAFEDIRAVFRWAMARGDIDHNPMGGMKHPGTSKPRERTLEDDEIRVLWNGLPETLARSKSCQRIIKLCLVTAQRVGEVAGMRIDEIDLKARAWNLPGARTKNGKSHRVPLSDLALAIIKEAMADANKGRKKSSPFVFPCGDDGALSPLAVGRTIYRAQEATKERPLGRFGLKHWTAHDLRRTALTNFAKLGIAPVVAGAVANHLSVTKGTVTLSVYTQYSYDREKREALDQWAERIEAIVDGRAGEVVPIRGAG